MVEKSSRCMGWLRERQSSSAIELVLVAYFATSHNGCAYPRSLIVTGTVPPSLCTPDLGKRPAGSHLVGSRGRSVFGDAQRLDLAHHDCKHTARKISIFDLACAYRVHVQNSRHRQCSMECPFVRSDESLVEIGMRQLALAPAVRRRRRCV